MTKKRFLKTLWIGAMLAAGLCMMSCSDSDDSKEEEKQTENTGNGGSGGSQSENNESGEIEFSAGWWVADSYYLHETFGENHEMHFFKFDENKVLVEDWEFVSKDSVLPENFLSTTYYKGCGDYLFEKLNIRYDPNDPKDTNPAEVWNDELETLKNNSKNTFRKAKEEEIPCFFELQEGWYLVRRPKVL